MSFFLLGGHATGAGALSGWRPPRSWNRIRPAFATPMCDRVVGAPGRPSSYPTVEHVEKWLLGRILAGRDCSSMLRALLSNRPNQVKRTRVKNPEPNGSRSLHCSCVGCCSEWGRCFAPRAGVGPGAEAMPADWRGRRHRTLRPPWINNGHLNCFFAKQHLQQCAPVTAVCKRGLWMCCSVRRGASGASSSLSFPCMLDFSCMLEFTFGSLPLETTQRAPPTRAGQTRE